jgi:hypothetical protein
MDNPEHRYRNYGSRIAKELKTPRRSFASLVGKACLLLLAVLSFALAAFILSAIMVPKSGSAQEGQIGDFGIGHAQWHHWYQTGENGLSLKRPYEPSISCCNGDCRPTLAKFRDGQWFALIDGQYDPIPESRIKRNVTSPSGIAHVCAAKRTNKAPIVPFCFVTPEGSS